VHGFPDHDREALIGITAGTDISISTGYSL